MKGQASVVYGLLTFFLLFIGIIMLAVISKDFFISQLGTNSFINFLINYLWFFVIGAGFIGFFAYKNTVGVNQ